MEFINVTINKKLYEKLKYLSVQRKRELKQHKNAGTIYPIYIVQEKEERIVDTNFYDYDLEAIYAYTTSGLVKFYTINDVTNYLEENNINKESINDIIENVKELEYIPEIIKKTKLFDSVYHVFLSIEYRDKAYFLTKEEAEEYIERQHYNLKNPRIYINFPGYSNASSFEDILELLDEENIFVDIMNSKELKEELKDEYIDEKERQLEYGEEIPIYLCAVCGYQITSNSSGICNDCKDHEEYKNGEYENRVRTIIK